MEGPTDQLVKIGAFARSARLTIRALHHYDEVGLLHPTRVDPSSGYRYYDLRQLPTAATIASLRQAGVDIDTIRAVLDGSDDLGSIIEREVERHERARRQAESAIAILRHLDEGPTGPTFGERPPTRLLGRSVTAPNDGDAALVRTALTELFERTDTPTSVDGHCVIRRVDNRQLYLDVGLPIDELGRDGVRPDVRGLAEIELPHGPVVQSWHRGPAEALTVTHAHLMAWCVERELRVTGPACETYVGDLDTYTTIVWVAVDADAVADVGG